ncbi:hypothetical protein KSP39_PZI005167 [Platanthera zijinensis]|uniref:Uncharacterized protein n=1 Tax=Platanthera zijinensis TaxID=2320716 RepID=A0AAP0GB84_9ASPA
MLGGWVKKTAALIILSVDSYCSCFLKGRPLRLRLQGAPITLTTTEVPALKGYCHVGYVGALSIDRAP